MNAAFLLVTTAWLAAAEADKAPAKPPAPPPPAACGAACCGDCNACCERQGLLARLRDWCESRKHRDCCDSCCPTTCVVACPKPCPKPCPAPKCQTKCCVVKCPTTCCDDGCERRGLFARLRDRLRRDDCCCETTCCAPKCKVECCKPTTCCHVSCGTCCDTGCERRGLFARLRDWCEARKHRDCCDNCCAPACGAPGKPEPIPAPKEPAKKLPTDEPMKPVSAIETVPAATLSGDVETKCPFELDRRYEARVDHAHDYSWLTGQLFYVHADGGLWILRYAPLWKEDPNGGSIVLARDLRMDDYHEGDLVSVHGAILSQKSSVFLGGPLYRAQSIQLVDRVSR